MPMTDDQRRSQIEDLRRENERLQRQLESQQSHRSDLALDDWPFTYTWKGETYGFDAIDVMEQVSSGESWDAVTQTKSAKQLADMLRDAAGMPADMKSGHVLLCFTEAVKKCESLGKGLESMQTSPPG